MSNRLVTIKTLNNTLIIAARNVETYTCNTNIPYSEKGRDTAAVKST